MISYAIYVIGCLTLITGLMIYLPVVLIRKIDRVLKVLQQIEANSHKP